MILLQPLVLLMCASVVPATRTTRHYFVAAVEVDWNYAPSGHNLVGKDDENSRDKIERRIDRVGSGYKKVIYKGFTDSSYTEPILSPPWAGFLGPTIRGEVGDMIYVHFKNMAKRSNYSVHPHGFQYTKANEGAMYIDGTNGGDKYDDSVPPGGAVTYVWDVSRIHAPTKQDDNCVAWGYHSHTMAGRDISSGLTGFALTCRKGVLSPDGSRKDVDRELFLYADIANENENWYFKDSLHNCGDPRVCKRLEDIGDRDFIESNDMYHINGYTYGNLPDFQVCEGENVVWYFMSLNLGIHTMHINGQTMVVNKKRTDTVTVTSASFYSGYMKPINPGRWLVYCRNQLHYAHGMQAFLDVKYCPKINFQMQREMEPIGMTRKYFIAIEEVIWDYAPNRKHIMVSEDTFLQQGNQRIGSSYKKAIYREYLDETFMIPKPRGIHELHEGLAGPPIKAEVGDKVIVVILNRASRAYSFLANGVSITKDYEGAFYKQIPHDQGPSGAIVHPGDVRAYKFEVPQCSAPTKFDTNCITYVYHSAVDVQRDIYTGLFGPLLVCKRGELSINRLQKGVDREFFLNWMVIDENLSWYIDQNINAFTRKPWTVNKEDEPFTISNQIRAINGRSFGTLEGLSMCLGDTVAWHMYGLGERFDHHHFSFEGNNFQHNGRRIDAASVFPGTSETVMMVPDQAGRLMLRTGQLGYEFEGMYVWYDVMVCTNHKHGLIMPPRIIPNIVGVIRRYYIAVVEGNWDYCPVKIDPITGRSLWNHESTGFQYVRDDPDFVGSIYFKALFREFTDKSFRTVKSRTKEVEHLGMLGPFVKANVGDTVEIVFKNMASHAYNFIPRNLVFSDGSAISDALPTMPGQVRMYSYTVPKRSGPNAHEPNCVGSSYFSRVHPLNDTNSGLFGPIVICKPGVLDLLGRRTDQITKEFALAFAVIDENTSNYKMHNFRSRAPARSPDNYTDAAFVDSNRYYTINGLIYSNVRGLNLYEGEKSAWYIFGVGSTFGIHTAHFHGQLYLQSTSLAVKRDVLEIFPGTYDTVEMLGYNPGTWILHCHVSLHTANGMKAMYKVIPRQRAQENTDIMPTDIQYLPDMFASVGFPKMPEYQLH